MWWILVVLICVTSAQADVTRKYQTTLQMWGASESSATDYYTSDKHTSESTTKWTRGVMKTMTGGKPVESSEITRLDRELVWTVDPKEKEYKEMTFAEFKEQMRKGMDAMKDDEDKADTAAAEDMYEWTVMDLSDANPKTINGWNCNNLHVEAKGVNKHNADDQVVITLNTWNSTDVPGAEEIRQFSEKFAKALGLDVTELSKGMSQAGVLYQKQWQAMMEAAKNAPGEAVQSLIEIKHQRPKGPSVKDAVAEGMKNEVMGKLPFGKKKAKPEEAKVELVWKTRFSATTDLKEATAGSVDAAKFEVPAGYKLKK